MSEPVRDFVSEEQLERHLWERLESAAGGGDSAFRVAGLSTIDLDGHPDARSVVIRRVDIDSRQIQFHTDRRSTKIGQLRREPRACLLLWDPSSKTQLRLRGIAAVEENEATVRAMIEQSAQSSLAVYRSRLPPSTPIESPEDAEMAPEPVLENLAVVTVTVTSMDWLWLDEAGHRRCRFEYSKGNMTHQWLVP